MKRFAWICLLFGLAAGAPAAAAQQSSSSVILFGNPNGHPPVSTTVIPAQTSGELTVSFHGDPSTGCAAQGLCAYSGTVVFRDGSPGQLAVNTYRVHGRVSYQVELDLPSGTGTLTAARVTRAGGGTCSDAQQPSVSLPGSVAGGEVTIGLIQSHQAILSTRCAGPLDADLAGLGPQIRLTVGQLLRGRRTLPLSGTWSFAAGGFAGTIDSNLTMVLGKPITHRSATSQQFPRGFRTRRDREVIETLTLVRGSGSLSMALGGDPTTCQFLDSCGIRGTLSGTFAPRGGIASLFVLGPAGRPYVDFLAALGLSRHGNPRGLHVGGALTWSGGGPLAAQLEQGSSSCTSTALLPAGVVTLATTRGRRLTATYSPIDPARTRCPGPEFGQFQEFQTLASGGIGPAALRRSSFTLHLSGSGPLGDDGYTIRQRTSLTLTLRRGRVHQHTLLVPAF